MGKSPFRAFGSVAGLARRSFDGTIQAIGDSRTSIGAGYDTRYPSNGQNIWDPRGIMTQLVMLSGGRLRPAAGGYPRVTGANSNAIYKYIVVNGGQSYNAATTTASVDTGSGGTGATCSLTIVNGVIVSASGAGGTSYSQSPKITISDSSGSGSGGIVMAVRNGNGCFADGGVSAVEAEGFVPDFLASGASICLYLAGVNDTARSYTQAQCKAAIVRTMQKLVAGGVLPIILAELPEDDTVSSTNKRRLFDLERWIMQTLPSLVPGAVPVNANPWLTDPGNSDRWLTDYTTDGLHQTVTGAYNVAKRIWAQIKYLLPDIGGLRTYGGSTFSRYDATNNIRGNLLATNQILAAQGTPGSADSPFTGQKFAGLTLSAVNNTGTGTVEASVNTRSDGRTGYVQTLNVDVTGETAGAIYRMRFGNATQATFGVQGGNTLQTGDTIQAILDELTMSGVSGLRGIKWYLQAYNSSALSGATGYGIAGCNYGENTSTFPAYTESLFLPTREMTLENALAFGVDLVLDFVCNAGAVSFTAKASGASVRRLSP